MCGCKRQPWTTAVSKLDLKIQTFWDVTVCFGVCGAEISKKKCPNLLRFNGTKEYDALIHYKSVLRWVHTCNVTACRNAVTLQVTDTIRSYELNFHPVPRGVTVSYVRYTLGFPVCYGSPSDVFAASSGFVHLYTLRFQEERTVVTCHVARPHLLRP
jgi:hypothetical protein